MNKNSKKVALKCATFAALFGLMSFFMDMMEQTEEQTTYSITLQDLALGNGETNGETGENGGNGGGGGTDGESSPPPPPPTQKLKKVPCYCPSPVDKSGSTLNQVVLSNALMMETSKHAHQHNKVLMDVIKLHF